MLHVCLLPIVIIMLIAFHFYSLRIPHVNNEIGEELDFEIEAQKYKSGDVKGSKVIPFWPAFLAKDFMYICLFMIFFFYLVCFKFNFAMDPINFDPADALQTPTHIYPEWYFLWSYEVLRGFFFDIGSIKAFDIGLAAFGIAQVIFLLLPWLDRSDVVKPAHHRPLFFWWFWILLIDLIALTIYGKLPPEGIFTWIGFYSSFGFLLLLLVALPVITSMERKKESK